MICDADTSATGMCNADKGSAVNSVESVRRFLRLYRKEWSRPWFDTITYRIFRTFRIDGFF